MTNLKHIFYITVLGFLFTSCSNYSMISDNDVYLQKPPAIDLAEDNQDITSFNAYKAGRKGAFQDGDNRLRNTNARAFNTYNNQFMFGTYLNPFHNFYPTDPFIWGRPYGYGYGLNSSFYGMNTYYSPGYGYGNIYGYNNSFYNSYQYGNFMSPYYSHNHYGINYIGPDANYSGLTIDPNNASYFGSSSKNQHYGHRKPLSGSSNRSSSYPETLKNKMHSNSNSNNPKVISKKVLPSEVVNRRKVTDSQREYVRTNVNSNRNTHNGTSSYRASSTDRGVISSDRRGSSSYGSNRTRSYSPSNSARRSGTVRRSSSYQNRSGSYNSSSDSRGGSYNSGSGNSNMRRTYSSPQRSSGNSYNRSSSGSSMRSSGSSTRSSGTSTRSSGTSSRGGSTSGRR